MTPPISRNRTRSGAWFALWTAAVVCPAVAVGADATLVVGAGANESTLALKGSPAFHSTTNEIVAPTLIDIPNSAGVAAVWSEIRPSGDTVDFYAISRDGQSFSRVFETSYLLKLRYAEFDPASDAPWVPPLLQADQASRIHIVQFVTQPLGEFQALLTEFGATVHIFLAYNAMIVEMEPVLADIVAQLPIVRSVVPFHPAYRLDESILAAIEADAFDGEMRHYSIQAFGRGLKSQLAIANRIAALGGSVMNTAPDGFRMTVTLTLAQVLDIAHMNEAHFIDPWGRGETDMDIVREIGGANYIETQAGYTGQGVRGEIFDTEVDANHPEWNGQTPLLHGPNGNAGAHGTSVYGICFSTGVVRPQARGLLPDGEQGIFSFYPNSTQFGGPTTRLQQNTEATDPNGPFRSVFQTSSVGSPRTTQYTTISAETDDYLFQVDYLSCQSMSNANLVPQTRPQAWAKNIVGVSGVNHQNTLTRVDDSSAGSTGPAADGRIKPDLTHFYSGIFTTSAGGGYTQFGGTSGATPITVGHFGLLFQMWHEGVFPGFGGGTSVFDSRPKSTTAKAIMINAAFRYDWNQGGANANMFRDRQGWGMADVGNIFNIADNLFIVDETDLIDPLGLNTYFIDVLAGDPEFRATLVYIDPAGNPAASVARINDLTLKVISPGGLEYWGNNGLRAGNYSTPGGSASLVDTTENVFIQNPEVGRWTVEIYGDEIVQDSHLETPGLDADYALAVFPGRGSIVPPPFRIRFVSGPSGLLPAGTISIVEVDIIPGTENIVPGSETVFYRYDGGAFNAIVLTPVGNDRYTANLPAVDCGDTPEYYFQAEGDQGTIKTLPGNAPTSVFSFEVGTITELYHFDFEVAPDWTAENLGATSGDWQRGVPVNDPNWAFDPISDSDGSGQCFLTENELGNTDVDDGAVRLTSSLFDLAGVVGISISYDYYLRLTVTTGGVDRLLVEISSNDMAGPWTEIARHTSDGGTSWRTHVITQDDLNDEDVDLSNEDTQEQLDELLAARIAGLHNEQEEVKLLLETANRCQAQGLDARAEALLDLLYRTQQDENDPELKFLIFTEFVPTQQMLAELLEQHGFTTVCLNGSMDLESRQRV